MKKIKIVLGIGLIWVLVFSGFWVISVNAADDEAVAEEAIYGDLGPTPTEYESIAAYAASLSMLEENQGKSKEEMLDVARAYQTECLVVEEEIADYYEQNNARVMEIEAELSGDDISSIDNASDLEQEYQELLEGMDALCMKGESIDAAYGIDRSPIIYYTVYELEKGIEDSLEILAMCQETVLQEGEEPKTAGYTREDFDELYIQRIAAEQAVLDELKVTDDPDLYDFAVKLYQTRRDHPVIE